MFMKTHHLRLICHDVYESTQLSMMRQVQNFSLPLSSVSQLSQKGVAGPFSESPAENIQWNPKTGMCATEELRILLIVN